MWKSEQINGRWTNQSSGVGKIVGAKIGGGIIDMKEYICDGKATNYSIYG